MVILFLSRDSPASFVPDRRRVQLRATATMMRVRTRMDPSSGVESGTTHQRTDGVAILPASRHPLPSARRQYQW
jgi:hypothetical protein